MDTRLLREYVDKTKNEVYRKIIEVINKVTIKELVEANNLYILKARYIIRIEQFIEGIIDPYVHSIEEKALGDWLKGLAVFINKEALGGRYSQVSGIDLEFDKDNTRYIVTIKSVPNWGDSSQIAKLISDFKTAKKTLRTSNSQLTVVAVNGCCYGRDKQPDKGDYFKFCGQEFWEFISGDPQLYIKIIEPLGHLARERNDDFMLSYSQMVNKFTTQFAVTFCRNNGSIDWDKLVRFNSAISYTGTKSNARS